MRSSTLLALVLAVFAQTALADVNVKLSRSTTAMYVEALSRGVVVLPASSGVLISWRLLGTESSSTYFYVYRSGTLIATVKSSTNYQDTSGSTSYTYTVKAVVGSTVGSAASARVLSKGYVSIPITAPSGGTVKGTSYTYEVNDGTPADVDGDGEYEIIIKWFPSNYKDNSQSGYTGPTYIDCYCLNGTRLWRINMGINIRSGSHYVQMVAFDLDSDGKAELMLKTSDGTYDGTGAVIGSSTADYRNSNGYILSGNEYLTVFKGTTGAAMKTVNYAPLRGTVKSWGDSYGNRVDRFLAGVAYIDGSKPSAIFARGYYTRAVIVAWNWRSSTLTKVWTYDAATSGSGLYGQGAHWFSVADVTGDQKHDIIYGAGALKSDGTLLYRTGLGHGDALHCGDLNPSHSGLEVFMVHESTSAKYGMEMHDADTGAILWGVKTGEDTGRGVCMDVTASYAGEECWSTYSGSGLRSATGTTISSSRPSYVNFAVWWDGDLLREELDKTIIKKWASSGETNLLSCSSCASCSSTKATPVLSADLFGDWREEVVWRSSSNDYLYIYTTPIVTTYKIPTLMHDPQYRCQVAGQNMAYNQPPHPSFFLGYGMSNVSLPTLTTP